MLFFCFILAALALQTTANNATICPQVTFLPDGVNYLKETKTCPESLPFCAAIVSYNYTIEKWIYRRIFCSDNCSLDLLGIKFGCCNKTFCSLNNSNDFFTDIDPIMLPGAEHRIPHPTNKSLSSPSPTINNTSTMDVTVTVSPHYNNTNTDGSNAFPTYAICKFALLSFKP